MMKERLDMPNRKHRKGSRKHPRYLWGKHQARHGREAYMAGTTVAVDEQIRLTAETTWEVCGGSVQGGWV
jgi:hypothetical protein